MARTGMQVRPVMLPKVRVRRSTAELAELSYLKNAHLKPPEIEPQERKEEIATIDPRPGTAGFDGHQSIITPVLPGSLAPPLASPESLLTDTATIVATGHSAAAQTAAAPEADGPVQQAAADGGAAGDAPPLGRGHRGKKRKLDSAHADAAAGDQERTLHSAKAGAGKKLCKVNLADAGATAQKCTTDMACSGANDCAAADRAAPPRTRSPRPQASKRPREAGRPSRAGCGGAAGRTKTASKVKSPSRLFHLIDACNELLPRVHNPRKGTPARTSE